MTMRVLLGLILICGGVRATADDIPSLIARFQAEHGIPAKEAILMQIVDQHRDAAPELLKVAEATNDVDTKWLAIRGLGILKFEPATPFLIRSLRHPHQFVRANAAQALAYLKAESAEPELLALLEREQDSAVLTQTSLALVMLRATRALPVLKKRAENVDSQALAAVVGAVGSLGGRADVPFLAKYVYDPSWVVAGRAAAGIERITVQDTPQVGPVSVSAKAPGSCSGLHAGVYAAGGQGYNPPSVVVALYLLNDTDSSLNVSAGSWKLVIDGVELADSGFIFGNGPMPMGGYRVLAAGQHYELGKTLPISRYFSRPGEHTVSWKGNAFQSPAVTVVVPSVAPDTR